MAIVAIGLLVSVIPARAAGPQTGTLLIHIYYQPDIENADLEKGILDINDWPLSSEWISKFAKMPDKITLREYTEIGMMEFDLNNQKWPTGWPGFFDPKGDPHYNASWHFRRAIAHLTNKDRIVTDILKGYGYKLTTPLVPALKMYERPGLTDYQYSRDAALAELAAGGFYYEGGLWMWGGEPLPKLKIYIRLDDPNRMTAGQYLVEELRAIGFTDAQLDVKITERAVCYQYVMVLYDYHIYTGGWSLSADPDYLYDLWSSEYYIGWGAPLVGWAPNYPGFCHHDFDYWAGKLKYSSTPEEAMEASWKATEIFLQMEPIVPLWSAAAVKAYKAGSTGVVNINGYGVDNGYTFLRMAGKAAEDGKIDYGFKSEPEALHVICSQWLWDWNVIGLVYDSLIGRNPFDLSKFVGWLATEWTVGTWDMGGGKLGTEIRFKIRSGVIWQDGERFTVDDVVFSWQFTKKCGAGVAWNYAAVRDMNSSWSETDALGNKWAVIRYNKLSQFFLISAGGLPIIPKHIWEARFPDWNTTTFNPAAVRTYHPWEVKKTVGTEDLTEMIGTGPWKFPYGGWVKGAGGTITLKAYGGFYRTVDEISSDITNWFWMYRGDATAKYYTPGRDVGVISGQDIVLVVAHLEELGRPYNSACDFNMDNHVNYADYEQVYAWYGQVVG
jgi:peptide/nickel transport system substrate-binding protein